MTPASLLTIACWLHGPAALEPGWAYLTSRAASDRSLREAAAATRRAVVALDQLGALARLRTETLQ